MTDRNTCDEFSLPIKSGDWVTSRSIIYISLIFFARYLCKDKKILSSIISKSLLETNPQRSVFGSTFSFSAKKNTKNRFVPNKHTRHRRPLSASNCFVSLSVSRTASSYLPSAVEYESMLHGVIPLWKKKNIETFTTQHHSAFCALFPFTACSLVYFPLLSMQGEVYRSSSGGVGVVT